MAVPGFTASFAIGAARGYYAGQSPQPSALLVQPALIIPIDICVLFPQLCAPQPAIQVNWLNCGNQSGYVLVTGHNFAANSGVQADVSNCSGAFPVPVGATTDANGSFTAWVPCDCGGSTTVSAVDIAGNTAQGTTALPC